jgi:hypothetical protein
MVRVQEEAFKKLWAVTAQGKCQKLLSGGTAKGLYTIPCTASIRKKGVYYG